MRRRSASAVTISAALFSAVAAAALAQSSDSTPAPTALTKAKSKAPVGGTVTVKVTNWRNADLMELDLTVSGSASWRKILGPLKAGQWC